MRRSLRLILAGAFCAVLASVCRGESESTTRPSILNGVGIDQRLGQTIPLDLPFRDSTGREVRLGDCFHGRPVLLMMVYYECPMLCTVTLNQLSRSLNVLSESAGDQFDVVTVSFNPNETPGLAATKKQSYMRVYRRPTAESGWHFLTGSEGSVTALAHSIGFRYTWDAEHQQFVHASAVLVVSPAGNISRYFLGVDYPPTELRQAMNEARAGTIGPVAESVFLYCFHYDPTTGRYGLIISRAIRIFGLLTLAGLSGLIMFYLHRERRLRRE